VTTRDKDCPLLENISPWRIHRQIIFPSPKDSEHGHAIPDHLNKKNNGAVDPYRRADMDTLREAHEAVLL